MRFWDPSDGVVTLGTTDLRNYQLDDLRSRIALVAQDTYLFNNSLRENILIAKPTASDTELAQAGELAALSDLVKSLPQGLNTPVGERGTSLSGGQRQRVAIARALSMNPTLMLMDEPTSALDPELVGDVLSVLQKLAEDGMTRIIVTHELGFAAKFADRSLFTDKGLIVEEGVPQQLLQNPETDRLK